jgi:hypothetical protein
MPQSYFTNYNYKPLQAPQIGETKLFKMIEEELTYQQTVKEYKPNTYTKTKENLLLSNFWQNIKEKLTPSEEFGKKIIAPFRKYSLPLIAAGLSISNMFAHVEPSRAMDVDQKTQTEFVQTNPEYKKVETKQYITNPDPTTEVAKTNLKNAGLENLKPEIVAKAAKKLGLDLSRQSETNQLKPLVKLMNEDGTLNQVKVKQARFNYLIVNETAPADSKDNIASNLFNGNEFNQENETIKKLITQACPDGNNENCTAEVLNNYIKVTLGYNNGVLNLSEKELSDLLDKKQSEITPPIKTDPTPAPSATPSAAPSVLPTPSTPSSSSQTPKTNSTLPSIDNNSDKSKGGDVDSQILLAINNTTQSGLNNTKINKILSSVGEQEINGSSSSFDESRFKNKNLISFDLQLSDLKSVYNQTLSPEMGMAERISTRRQFVERKINSTNKATRDQLETMDSILQETNRTIATETNKAKRSGAISKAANLLDLLEKKIIAEPEIKKETSWWATGIASVVAAFAFAGVFAINKIKGAEIEKQQKEIEKLKKGREDDKTSKAKTDKELSDLKTTISSLQSQIDKISNTSSIPTAIPFTIVNPTAPTTIQTPDQTPKPAFEIKNMVEMKNWTQAEIINYNQSVFTEIKQLDNAVINSIEAVNNYVNKVLNTKQIEYNSELVPIYQPDSIQYLYDQIGNDLISFGATQELGNCVTSVIATLRNQEKIKNNPTPPRQNTNQ